MSCAEDDHGGAAVQSVASSHNLPARLQGVTGGQRSLVRLLEDGKDGADGDEAVNVGAAVQGVERDDVLALPLRLNLDLVLVFLNRKVKVFSQPKKVHLRDEQTGCIGRSQHVDEEVVGKHVQLLHLLTLDIGQMYAISAPFWPLKYLQKICINFAAPKS